MATTPQSGVTRDATPDPRRPRVSFDGHITLSLGVATFDEHMQGIDHVLKLADDAVYRAKSDGRNCVRQAKQSDSPED